MKKRNCNWLNPGRLHLILAALWLLPHVAPATTRTVTSLNDNGAGSLRDTIVVSAPGDTINFSIAGTITLTNGELSIAKDLTIIGPTAGLPRLTLDATDTIRVFGISSNITVNISNLSIIYSHSGGGVYNVGTLTLNNCDISRNSSFFLAGGIYNGGTLTVNGCRFFANTGALGGGILNSNTLTVNNCTFIDNAANAGGAIYNAGLLTANNSTFSDNDGGDGGGIYNVGSLYLVNCTLSGNAAFTSFTGSGGGIYQSGDSGATLIRNTIVAGNIASGVGPDVTGRMGFGFQFSQGHNLIGQTNGSTGWVSSDLQGDPLLGPLQDNGGLNSTMALLSRSPAIDAGDDAVVGSPFNLITDQRGRSRSSGAHVDIGAYEVNLAPLVTNTNDNGAGSLRDAILVAAPSDAINFASNVVGTITLTSGEIVVGKNHNINGPGARVLTVSGNNATRVFHITGGACQISNLRIVNGQSSAGGGGIILDGVGVLTVSNCAISGCYAQGLDLAGQGGGAVALVGATTLSLVNSTIASNTARFYGGGIFLFGGAKASLVNSTVSGNRTLDGLNDEAWGGGIYVVNGSTLNVTNSTIANNTSVNAGGGVYKSFNGTATFRNSLIAGNSAPAGPDCYGPFVSAGYNLVGNTTRKIPVGA